MICAFRAEKIKSRRCSINDLNFFDYDRAVFTNSGHHYLRMKCIDCVHLMSSMSGVLIIIFDDDMTCLQLMTFNDNILTRASVLLNS